MYVYVPHAYLVPIEARRGCQILGNRMVVSTVSTLGIERTSFARAVSALHSPAPDQYSSSLKALEPFSISPIWRTVLFPFKLSPKRGLVTQYLKKARRSLREESSLEVVMQQGQEGL